MTSLVSQLQGSALTHYLSGNALAFPVLEIIHVLAIALVLGTLFIVDLRLVGLGWLSWAWRGLAADLLPVTLGAFALALVSGLGLFASQPEAYVAAWPFQLKLLLLALAGANAGAFHLWIVRLVPAGAGNVSIPLVARLSGAASLLLWILILGAGRLIGFVVIH